MSDNELLDHILSEVVKLRDSVTEIKVEVAKLKITAGLWGAAAGSLPVLVVLAYIIFYM